jgi:hypothetical protein
MIRKRNRSKLPQLCDCGRMGVRKQGSSWECAFCIRANKVASQLADKAIERRYSRLQGGWI